MSNKKRQALHHEEHTIEVAEIIDRTPELHDKNTYFKAVTDSTRDAIIIIDDRGCVIFWNPAAEQILGYAKEKIIGKNLHDVLAPEHYLQLHKDAFVKFQRKGIGAAIDNTIELEARHQDGHEISIELSLSRIRFQGKYHAIGIVRDITERKKAEEDLRKSEERFKALHNASFGGILIHDKGVILDCNRVLSEISGYSIEELIGMDGLLLISEDFREKVMSNMQAGYEKPYEVVGLRKSGEEYPLRLEVGNIPYRDRNMRVVEFRDISHQKKLEAEREVLQEQLRQAHKMEAIGTLAGGIAHDFNNMLGGIMGAAEMMALHLPKDEHIEKYRKIIVKSAERAANLTEQLLTFSRVSPRTSTALDIHEVLGESLVLVRNTIDKRVSLKTDFTQETSTVVGDFSQLQSMLLNLCINSAHAMPEGGVIDIRTQTCALDEAACRDYAAFDLIPGRYIEIQISDTGEGIEPEHLPKIFDPFFTTKKQGKGTGLGLASVFGAMQQHQGAITVTSREDVGTVFTLLLPLSNSSIIQQQAEPGVLRGRGRVLVVDDEEVMRSTAKGILEDLGYTVITAKDGKEALELFRKTEERIDLVLLDMIMPVLNGKDCFRRLRKMDSEVCVVLSSGFTREEDLQDMLAEGLKGFIRKPYKKGELSRLVYQVLSTA
ncbi:PAS domain-containing hybrid sensor histidine kinase/response regulator [Desulfopila sp. IMCC35008]|uniref:PAS domain-containing hybrid sensor histidine kinase/response regulator n=1 Tax=Desulfopila sp. IMCC35008 TaxID=2653858 RepID=UPI0013D8C9CC|nr:PAS domain-containing hybrid sensor histidine kinase/response regulator [Desulfopila sp. IMCC35008]